MAITLAVDCMGGDHGPSVTLPAVFEFLRHDTDDAARDELSAEELSARGADRSRDAHFA